MQLCNYVVKWLIFHSLNEKLEMSRDSFLYAVFLHFQIIHKKTTTIHKQKIIFTGE